MALATGRHPPPKGSSAEAVDLLEHGEVITHRPVFNYQSVADPEHVQLRPADLRVGHPAAGQAGKRIADVTAVRGVPDHDTVRVKHGGVMFHPAIREAVL